MRLLLLALAWTILLIADIGTASAQEPGRVYRIGWLWVGWPGSNATVEKFTNDWAALRDALRDSGYVVGKNLVVDVRDAQGDVSRLPAVAEALAATQPDVLITTTTAPTVAAIRATKTIPIVFFTGDPVARGIVKSLANPGGNATGQTGNLSRSKVWQLLRDVAPGRRRGGWVGYAPNIFAQDRSTEYRARRLAINGSESAQAGFELIDLMVDRLDELELKVSALANGGEAALVMVSDQTLFSWRAEIMEMAMRYRLPTACDGWFGWAKAGCLIAYGEDGRDQHRRAAAQVVKIFNGTKPADIPVEQPTKFKLIINAKTAKALDLAVPSWVLAGADEVIE